VCVRPPGVRLTCQPADRRQRCRPRVAGEQARQQIAGFPARRPGRVVAARQRSLPRRWRLRPADRSMDPSSRRRLRGHSWRAYGASGTAGAIEIEKAAGRVAEGEDAIGQGVSRAVAVGVQVRHLGRHAGGLRRPTKKARGDGMVSACFRNPSAPNQMARGLYRQSSAGADSEIISATTGIDRLGKIGKAAIQTTGPTR
jgi:hypothetical protein